MSESNPDRPKLVPNISSNDGTAPEPTLGRRARQRADTRERLFLAALDEFRTEGVAAAQIDRIAKAAGVVRGTFYFHFPTKDDVLFELRRRSDSRILARMAALSSEHESLRDGIIRFNSVILDEHQALNESGLLGELLALYARRTADFNLDPSNRLSIEGELTAHFERAQQRGEVRSDLDPERMTVLVLGSLRGFYTNTTLGSRDGLQTLCDSLIDVMLKGLAPH
jgi:AcrR family transcriptional regulator